MSRLSDGFSARILRIRFHIENICIGDNSICVSLRTFECAVCEHIVDAKSILISDDSRDDSTKRKYIFTTKNRGLQLGENRNCDAGNAELSEKVISRRR